MATHEDNKRRFGVKRPGKTAKDRHEGQHQRNLDNKSARITWQHGEKSRAPASRSNNTFPKTACNGKKNRHRWMGKCAEYEIHS